MSARVFLRAGSADKTLVVVEGALHSIWWERHATRRTYFLHMLDWMLARAGGAGAPPPDAFADAPAVATTPSVPPPSAHAFLATPEEEAEVRSLIAAPQPASGAPAPPPGCIQFMQAAQGGPFRVPGDPLSGWLGSMAVEPGNAVTLAERYAASDPAKGSRFPPLTWDAAPENRYKPGVGGPGHWRRELPG